MLTAASVAHTGLAAHGNHGTRDKPGGRAALGGLAAHRRAAAFAAGLLALGALCACATPTPPPAPAPALAPVPAPSPVELAVQELGSALAMRAEPELWFEVRHTAELAAETLRAAQTAGATDPELQPALAAAETLAAWQALRGIGAFHISEESREEWNDSLLAIRQALLGRLRALDAPSPQAHAVALLILLDSGLDEEAAAEFALALQRFPADARLHALLRGAHERLPDPEALARLLAGRRADTPAAAPLLLASEGYLLLAAGRSADRADALDDAAALAGRAADAFAAARQAGETASAEALPISRWELDNRLADAAYEAGQRHRQIAGRALAESGLPAARPHLEAAEAAFARALEVLPEDQNIRDALASTADTYYQAGDLVGIREAFGRLARRFDLPEWWNNHAFFCRETGLYEEAYASYSRCIELAPDNARWVNDTALILLYHLDRDLDHAEALFRRAIALATEVAANPFLDETAIAQNEEALGDAMLNLALLAARRGELDQAAELLAELLARAPHRADARALSQQVEAARGAAGHVPLPR